MEDSSAGDLCTNSCYGLSLLENRMWSFDHPSFNSELPYASFDVDGFQYTWPDGIFSITLGNRDPDGYRTAYYHPMARYSDL